jgi:hypothetical protein
MRFDYILIVLTIKVVFVWNMYLIQGEVNNSFLHPYLYLCLIWVCLIYAMLTDGVFILFAQRMVLIVKYPRHIIR